MATTCCFDPSRAGITFTGATPLSRKPNASQIDDNPNHNFVKFWPRPTCSNRIPSIPMCRTRANTRMILEKIEQEEDEDEEQEEQEEEEEEEDNLWLKMREEARLDIDEEPVLSTYYYGSILSQDSLESALANHLSLKLSSSSFPSGTLNEIFLGVLTESQEIMFCVREDLKAGFERDPACISYVHCFLNYKGFMCLHLRDSSPTFVHMLSLKGFDLWV